MATKLQVLKGDIVDEVSDAIVNAANELLLGGGGVDGVIHQYAGPRLAGECANLPMRDGVRCAVGQARMTAGYNLRAKYVIHTVGPTWPGAGTDEMYKETSRTLRSCYFSCLTFAWLQGLRTISFPCISTGAFCFPPRRAAQVALFGVNWFLSNHATDIEVVRFVCFDDENYQAYKEAAESLKLNVEFLDNETPIEPSEEVPAETPHIDGHGAIEPLLDKLNKLGFSHDPDGHILTVGVRTAGASSGDQAETLIVYLRHDIPDSVKFEEFNGHPVEFVLHGGISP